MTVHVITHQGFQGKTCKTFQKSSITLSALLLCTVHKVTRFNVLSMGEVPYLPDKRLERTCSLKLNLFNVTSTESDTKSDNGNTSNVSILESLL